MVGEVYGESWRLTRLHWLTSWLLVFTGMVASAIVGFVLADFLGLGRQSTSLLTSVLTLPVNVGVFMSFVGLARGAPAVGVNSVLDAFDKFVPLCITSVAVWLVTVLGLILFIVPGVILALGLGFAPYLVIDRNLDAAQAMRASWDLMLGHKFEAFLLAVASILLVAVSAIPLGLGLLLSIPMVSFAQGVFYNRVVSRKGLDVA